ncbi:MAG: hypothetical protein H3C34_15880 [Caldilineaceae bacterium]|nr:hypothetical protein [Caldilineaceae bacterium]
MAALEFANDGTQRHFRGGEAMRVALEPIRNPPPGTEQPVAVQLPAGMGAKREEHFSSKTFDVNAGGLSCSDPGRTATAMQSTWRRP